MKILAIESTCDETAAAVVEGDSGGVRVISSTVASSADIHTKYGGVVPEVAAREQIKAIIPVVNEAILGIDIDSIEAIAVSYGPGLIGSLLIGIETARTLAYVWSKPLIKVNHLSAHIAANWILDESHVSTPAMPAVGLIISGGHTDLVVMKDASSMEWVGGTMDDAAGEAFDKVARVLGLPYPGGPSIQKAAEDSLEKVKVPKLPRPMIHENNLKMSFSGLKAAVAKLANEELGDDQIIALAKEFNLAVMETLVKKTSIAIEKYQPRSLLIAGGVAANKIIRQGLQEMAMSKGVDIYMPEIKYCGDNAAMVGAAAVLFRDKVSIDYLRPEPGLGVY